MEPTLYKQSPRVEEIRNILRGPESQLSKEYKSKLKEELGELRSGKIIWDFVAGLRMAVLALVVWLIASAQWKYGFTISTIIGFLVGIYHNGNGQSLFVDMLGAISVGLLGIGVAVVVWIAEDSFPEPQGSRSRFAL